MSHVDTDLVRATCFWMKLDETPVIFCSGFEDLVAGFCRLSFWIDDYFCLISPASIEAEEWSIDDSFTWVWHTSYEGVIGFFYFSGTELLCHVFVGETIETGDNNA
jgi:hypothetical protein